jgi:hypothetical protein
MTVIMTSTKVSIIGGNAIARRLGHVDSEKVALFICDIQEKFQTVIWNFPMVVSNSERVLKVAKIFDIPILASEQYPKVILQFLFFLDLTFNCFST